MKCFSPVGLRVRLSILVLITIGPLLAILLNSALEDYRHSRLRAYNEALTLARSISQLQDNIINDSRRLLYTISQMIQMNSPDLPAISAVFNKLVKNQPAHTGFMLANRDGEVLVSAPSRNRTFTIADRSYFKRLIETGDFVIGESRIGEGSGKAIIPLAYPILDGKGYFENILITGLDLDWLNHYLSQVNLPLGTNLNVLDSQGKILLTYPGSEGFVGKSLPDSIVTTLLTKGEGVEEGPGHDEITRLYGFTSFGRPYGMIYVSVGIPKHMAFAEANRKSILNLALLALVALSTFAAASVGGEVFILRSVKRLLKVTKELAAGDLTARISAPYGKGEIAQLASSFDQMAEALEKREEELKQAMMELRMSEERYRGVFDHSLDAIYLLDLDGTIIDVNQSTCSMFGYTKDELIGQKIINLYANPLERPRLLKELEEKGFVKDYENKGRKKDGTTIDLLVTATIRRSSDGSILGSQGIARDITERKKNQERIRLESERTKALVDLAARINSQLDFKEVLKAICEKTAHHLNVPATKVSMYDEDKEIFYNVANFGLPTEIYNQLQPIPRVIFDRTVEKYGPMPVIPDIQAVAGLGNSALYSRANIRTYVFVSLRHQGKLIGALTVMALGSIRHFCDGELNLLQGLADQAAIAIANARLFEQVRAGQEELQLLSRKLVAVQENERRRMSRELHDEIGQSLTGLKYFIELNYNLSKKEESGKREAQRLINDLMEKVEEMSLNFRPSMLDDLGLLPALFWHFEHYNNQTGIYVHFKHHGLEERRLPQEIETAAYRIVQEALTNVARHASVNNVKVRLEMQRDMLQIEIEDQGRGFEPETVENSCGLLGMRERALLLGGMLSIKSSKGTGTRLVACLPLGNQKV